MKLQRTKPYFSKFAYLPRQCRPRRYCRHNETLSKARHHPQHSRTDCATRACRRRAFASRHTCQSSRISIAHKYRGDINIALRSLPRFLAIYSTTKNKGIPLRNGLFNRKHIKLKMEKYPLYIYINKLQFEASLYNFHFYWFIFKMI